MLSTTTIIYALVAILFIALIGFTIIIGRVLSSGDDVSDRIQTFATQAEEYGASDGGHRRVRFLRVRLRLNNALATLVPKGLRAKLTSANWQILESEYILIRLGGTLMSLLIGTLIGQSIFPGIGAALLAYLLPGMFLNRSISQRQRKFERQLVDVLILINGGVSAGYSLLQSLDIVVDEMPAPASEEFNQVRREVGLGLPLSKALENLAGRMENDDLDILVAAININIQVGGNLTTMLAAVTETIRERIRLFSEVRSITASQRSTGNILTLLPFLMGGAMFLMNPTYIARLFEPGWILCVPIGAVIGIILGNITIRKMIQIDI